MSKEKVSVIISARSEFPQVCFTIHSIIADLETFLKPEEFCIYLVDNGSDDNKQLPNITGTSEFLRYRGMFHDRILKILFDPVMGNVSARNKGVDIAEGEYIFFSDAHMTFKVGSFKAMIKAIDESGGMVHPAINWMGAYPEQPSYQYTICLGEKIWGRWNKIKNSDDWFYIPTSGHCCVGIRREQFNEFRQYNPYFRCYGGGEVYLDMKWWMMGSSSVCEPNAVVSHLSAGRGYSYHQDDFIHNMMVLAFALGGDAWGERVYIRYLDKPGVNKPILKELYRQAREEAEDDKKWILKNAKYSFDEVITKRMWDGKNKERNNNPNSHLLIFDETWIKNLKDKDAIEIYNNSSLQKELTKKIENEWSDLVYRKK